MNWSFIVYSSYMKWKHFKMLFNRIALASNYILFFCSFKLQMYKPKKLKTENKNYRTTSRFTESLFNFSVDAFQNFLLFHLIVYIHVGLLSIVFHLHYHIVSVCCCSCCCFDAIFVTLTVLKCSLKPFKGCGFGKAYKYKHKHNWRCNFFLFSISVGVQCSRFHTASQLI